MKIRPSYLIASLLLASVAHTDAQGPKGAPHRTAVPERVKASEKAKPQETPDREGKGGKEGALVGVQTVFTGSDTIRTDKQRNAEATKRTTEVSPRESNDATAAKLLQYIENDQGSAAVNAVEFALSGTPSEKAAVLRDVTAGLASEKDFRRRENLRAVDKRLRLPEMELYADKAGIHTALQISQPDLARSKPSRMDDLDRPIYIEDGLGVANLDPGAPLLKGIEEAWWSNNIRLVELRHHNAAIFVPDKVILPGETGIVRATRKTKDVSTPGSGSARSNPACGAGDPPGECVVFVVMVRRD